MIDNVSLVNGRGLKEVHSSEFDYNQQEIADSGTLFTGMANGDVKPLTVDVLEPSVVQDVKMAESINQFMVTDTEMKAYDS